MTNSTRIYFRGLNGIRAIAAMTVVIYHFDQFMPFFNLKSSGFYNSHWQSYAVTLFFVLSGFLITYLLTEEKARSGTISLKNFYIRRVLRIWPLYYFVVALSLLFSNAYFATGFPPIPFDHLACYGLLLANVVNAIATVTTPLTPLWSIGVEEQFYALWPIIVKRSHNLLISLVSVIVVYLFVKLLAALTPYDQLKAFVEDTRIDCMAIGGIGALIYRSKHSLLKYIYSRSIQVICWAIFLISFVFNPIHIRSSINHEIYSLVFIVIIINVSTNPKSIIDLEYSGLNFLGNISYGLYAYHMLVLFVMKWLNTEKMVGCLDSKLSVYVVGVASTIAISYCSWRFIETRFLQIKDRFSIVLSQSVKTDS